MKRVSRSRPSRDGHSFAVGQHVHLKPSTQMLPAPDNYSVIALLPPIGTAPQYRIRSEEERYDRVTTEDFLEPAYLLPPGSEDSIPEGQPVMAKGQKRSNREIRKPKQDKAPAQPAAPFGGQVKGASASLSAGKPKN
ncbi:MAG: hypothetical protein K5872_04690 [Rhizobiaceae bacterium]|nr:hypothetical protein [Rhizobiaceae bacterium]MCV0405507.1 hypothetical protein [Rhizobiaceae bacterium]